LTEKIRPEGYTLASAQLETLPQLKEWGSSDSVRSVRLR
jgi:hypothetical protein